jgi:hypothetical protein
MTELSSGFEIDGAETEIPILVPTLSFDDIEHLKNGGAITPEIARKAYAFAMQRKANGLPYFAEPGEYYSLPAPPLPPLPPLKE